MKQALLLTGGWAHPAEDSVESVADEVTGAGFELQVTESVDAVGPLLDRGVDLFVVNACRFRMLDDRYTDRQRDDWAVEITPSVRCSVVGHLNRGCPLLGLHAASICFDDWDEWGTHLGGRWQWGRSGHGPVAPVTVEVDPDHPVTAGCDRFTVEDECYAELAVSGDSEPFMSSRVDGRAQVLGWTRTEGPARVAYSALGHDRRSLDVPAHRMLLRRLLAWLTEDAR